MDRLLRALATWYLKRSSSTPENLAERRPLAGVAVRQAAGQSKREASARIPMILTSAQEDALRLAEGPEPFVFITGRAGSGKSTLIQRLKALEQIAVCAPTGIAALNCGG